MHCAPTTSGGVDAIAHLNILWRVAKAPLVKRLAVGNLRLCEISGYPLDRLNRHDARSVGSAASLSALLARLRPAGAIALLHPVCPDAVSL
jgi:hypothetical protein